ncbi:MAG: hypothetical protein AYK19_04655 [Theionarchaea archaeon DG-70-1]|nr:MAG: hypothetical protein AYK19_04655 [Theionarchaea archaeon DG-70-1]
MRDLNPTEMKLLHYLGKNPELTNSELATLLGLKNPPYVSTLKEALEKKGYFAGPYYRTDYGKIFRNRIRKAIAIVLFEQSYEFMFSLLKNVGCYSYLYPVEERFFRSYMVGIFDSDTEAVKEIFDYLKREGVIFHYELYLQDYQTSVIPPTFFINSDEATSVPSLDNLLEETEIPDLSLGEFEGITLSLPEQKLISYFELGTCVLTQIMEKEKAKGNFFTYAEWKVAKDLLQSSGVIQMVYDIFPFPQMDCSPFFLFVRAETLLDIQKILFNFGKDSRLFKKVFLWTSHQTQKTYGVIYCYSHPMVTIQLLRQMDMYEEIEDKKFFALRKKFSLWEGKSISLEFYDPFSCELYYLYDTYLEKVKTFVEENPW